MSPRTLERLRSAAEVIVLLFAAFGALMALAAAFGFRLDKPGARLEAVEVLAQADRVAIDTLYREHASIHSTLDLVVRIQCLGITRAQATVAGACKLYATKDDIGKQP